MDELFQEFTLEQRQKIQSAVTEVFVCQSRLEKERKVERFRRLNKFSKPGQILFAGSSLMEQFPIQELGQEYELPLRIYNRGIGGFTTEELLEAMGPCVYEVKPKYVFLNIGTNDLNNADCSMEKLTARYEKVLLGIRENLPEAQVTLLAYYPVNASMGAKDPFMAHIFQNRTNRRIQEANAWVERLAQRYGAAFLDVNAAITDENGDLRAEYAIDGMHMYADGYQKVLEALLPALWKCI